MERIDDRPTASMPKILLVLTAAVLFLRLAMLPLECRHQHVTAGGVQWISINDFKPEERQDRKYLLYEFGADWCEPCKRLENNVLKNRQIAALISSRFVPIQVRDKLKESGKNTRPVAQLEKKYHIFAFPTLVVANASGDVVATLVGSASALSTIHFLSRASRQAPTTTP